MILLRTLIAWVISSLIFPPIIFAAPVQSQGIKDKTKIAIINAKSNTPQKLSLISSSLEKKLSAKLETEIQIINPPLTTKEQIWLKIEEELSLGKTLYHEMEFKKAIQHLNIAKKLLYPNIEKLKDGELLFQTHLYLGISLLALDQKQEAQKEFLTTNVLFPDKKLNPKIFSPQICQLYGQTQKQIKNYTRISIISEPPFAAIYLNGQLRGITPLVLNNIPYWRHYLLISKNKYKDYCQEISLNQSDLIKLKYSLLPKNIEPQDYLNEFSLESEDTPESLLTKAKEIGSFLKVDQIIILSLKEDHLCPYFFERELSQMVQLKPIDLARVSPIEAAEIISSKLFAKFEKNPIPPPQLATSFALPPPSAEKIPLVKKWWFWGLVGGAVITTVALLYPRSNENQSQKDNNQGITVNFP